MTVRPVLGVTLARDFLDIIALCCPASKTRRVGNEGMAVPATQFVGHHRQSTLWTCGCRLVWQARREGADDRRSGWKR